MKSEIADFFKDKSVFITGVTGFLGKVLVEKLIRSCPQVKHIYVLIRSKKGQDVKTRHNDMLRSKVFEKLFECEPQSMSKVKAIEGDITLRGLGISDEDFKTLIRDVSIVFHSAATVRFNEPLKTAVNYNVSGTPRVIQLCRKLPKLLALIHVSTAYSNCNRQETEERVYPSPVPPQTIIDLCQSINDEMLSKITPIISEGFPNTYTYTKGLTENLLTEECHNIPTAIVRPSIVTASWKKPMPGWVDSLTGMTGYLLAVSKGVFRHGINKTNIRSDFIPVDTVINLMITIAWFITTHSSNGIHVYNCISGGLNPIDSGKIVEVLNPPYSIEYPSSNVYRYPSFNVIKWPLIYELCILFDHILPAYLYDAFRWLLGRKMFMAHVYDQIHRSYSLTSWFCSQNFQFSNKNLLELVQMLNGDDRQTFNFDIRSMDYYLGIRQFILKERNETLPHARENLSKIYFRDIVITILLILLLFISIYLIFVN